MFEELGRGVGSVVSRARYICFRKLVSTLDQKEGYRRHGNAG